MKGKDLKKEAKQAALRVRAKLNQADYAKKTNNVKASPVKTIATAALLGLSTIWTNVAKAETTFQRDGNDGFDTESVEQTRSPFLSNLTSDQNGYYKTEDVRAIAKQMYINSMTNYLESYINEAKEDVAAINKAKKQGKNYGKAVASNIGKTRINNLRQHCAEAGTYEAFMQDYTPQFLMDSVYRQFRNPNYAPTIFDDLRSIARNYGDNYEQFFPKGKGNIYKRVIEYNNKHNKSNECKLFVCQETNNGGKHFTILYYDGANYNRVSFNGEDVRNVKGYNFAETRVGGFCDVTGLVSLYIDNGLNKYNNKGKISKEDAEEYLKEMSRSLSSDTYQINPYEMTAQLEELSHKDNSGIFFTFQTTSVADFENLAKIDDENNMPHMYADYNMVDIQNFKKFVNSTATIETASNYPRSPNLNKDPKAGAAVIGRRESQYSIS